MTEYIKHTWYIQKQQITGYQPKESLYCVTATYNIDNYSRVPFFNGKVISVYNYANFGEVNGVSPSVTKPLCARQINESEPEKLYVSPCFLPNLFSGPYWILAAGPESNNYQWAIVGGGQPKIYQNKSCGYKTSGFKNAGLWLFSRKPQLEKEKIKYLISILKSKNIDTSNLLDVIQQDCVYKNAFIK